MPPPPTRPGRLAGAPPGPRKRDARLAGLLDAAAALFVEKGVAATSIEDIAERAGVAKSTFYHAGKGSWKENQELGVCPMKSPATCR